MRIRSITYFCDPGHPLDEDVLRQAGDFLAQARAAYETEGYEVQTTRLATVPFPTLTGGEDIEQLPRLAESLSALLPQVGIAYASLGPALPAFLRSYELIPEAIAASENIFFGGVMAEVLVDNARALVSRHDAATREVSFNGRFLAFARYWRFRPRQSSWRWRRHLSTTPCSSSRSSALSFFQAVEKEAVALRGRSSSGSVSNTMRMGMTIPSPTPMASAVPSEPSASSSPITPSESDERTHC